MWPLLYFIVNIKREHNSRSHQTDGVQNSTLVKAFLTNGQSYQINIIICQSNLHITLKVNLVGEKKTFYTSSRTDKVKVAPATVYEVCNKKSFTKSSIKTKHVIWHSFLSYIEYTLKIIFSTKISL